MAETGRRGGRETQEALARLHSGGSLNRSHAFAAEGGGSFAAPSGARSLVGFGAAAATVLPVPEVAQSTVGGFTPRGEMTIIAMNRYRQMSLGEWLQGIEPSGRFKMAKYQEEIAGTVQSNLEAQINS